MTTDPHTSGSPAASALTWPDKIEVWPRDPEGRPADPIVEVLALTTKPWELMSIGQALRAADAGIPAKAEAEYAAALHFLLTRALVHGRDWPSKALEELRAKRAAAGVRVA